MLALLRRWFGLRCRLRQCGGRVDRTASGDVCWRCSDCGKEIE